MVRSVDHEAILADLLTASLICTWLEQVKNFSACRLIFLVFLRLELMGPVLEDLAIWTTVAFNILTSEDNSEGQMWQAGLWLGLPEDGNVHVLCLLKGLNEAWLGLWLLFFLILLATGILEASENYSWQLVVLRHGYGCPCEHEVLQVVLGLHKT